MGEGERLSGNVDEGKGGLIESAAEVGNDEESAGQKKSERKRKKKDKELDAGAAATSHLACV